MLKEYINKIIHSDCLDIMKQLPDKCIDLVVTSPPYNLNIQYNSYNDNIPYDEYLSWTNEWIKESYRILNKGGRIAVNVPIETNLNGKKFICNDYINLLKSNRFIEMAFIIWDKANVTSRTAWGSFCSPSSPCIIQPTECILVFAKEDKKLNNNGYTDLTKKEFVDNSLGLWRIKPETDHFYHPVPFPLELPNRIIKMYSWVDSIVLDCFSGSGTTAIACHDLKRRFICIEKDEEYWQKSVERLEIAQAQQKLF